MKLWTRQECPECGGLVSVNNDRTMASHPRGTVDRCAGSRQQVDVRYRLGAWR